MILIDTNAFVLLIVGLVDINLISKHKRTSTYSKEDYDKLTSIIKSYERLVVLPNVWTEVDNLLNRFSGKYKWEYIKRLKEIVSLSSEKYLKSTLGIHSEYFVELGLTDSLLLELGKDCDLLITADSSLADIARAYDIKVYDLVEEKNRSFR